MNEIVGSIILSIGVVFIGLWMFSIGYSIGEDNIVQKLCTQQQYDFCEVIEQNLNIN